MEHDRKFSGEDEKSGGSRVSELADRVVTKLIREHKLACEKLTETQLAEAISQALLAGDFVRNVVLDSNSLESRQLVTYVPFRGRAELLVRIHQLEAKLESIETALKGFSGAEDER